MVKKITTTQPAVADHEILAKTISKKSSDKNYNLHSSVKVLRPYQVHITDSSTFKNLVQELTGNGNIVSTSVSTTSSLISSPTCDITSKPIDYEQVPVTQDNMMYNIENYGFQESSPELSFDSSDYFTGLASVPVISDSSQEIFDYMPITQISEDNEFQSFWDMMSFPVQYEEMESWLLEMDPCVYYNHDSYALPPVMTPEVCVFDYDISAIM